MSFTPVERVFLNRSGSQDSYPGEKIPVVEVLNVYELGRIVTLAFMEWVSQNPTGVVALPTGKTPEYFIKTLEKYRKNWNDEEIQNEIKAYGINVKEFPSTKGLRFVMLDEFFPMLPTHRNSFCNYIRNFYVKTLDISPENVLDFDLLQNKVLTEEEFNVFDRVDVDLSLLTRDATSPQEETQKAVLLKVEKFCQEYERKVQDLGGIGFFLGGIGPDGHIAFNQEGANHDSITRLVSFNYPSAAAAASDLGGIERARGKAAMTIGLHTITAKKDAKIIIMAAGEGKASVVRAAVEEEQHVERPSSVLHNSPNARFYLTHGAAMKLTSRKQERISQVSKHVVDFAMQYLSGVNKQQQTVPYLWKPTDEYVLLESCLFEASLSLKVPVHQLTLPLLREKSGVKGLLQLPNWLQSDELAFNILCVCASRRLKDKVEGGLIESAPRGLRILHTAPHHDDIMLSYHGAMHEMLGRQPAVNVTRVSIVADNRLLHSTKKQQVKKQHIANTLRIANSTGNLASMAGGNTGGAVATTDGARLRSGSFTSYSDNVLGEAHNGNMNHFAYLTSGFHSVNDDFLQSQVDAVLGYWPQTQTFFVDEAVKTGQLSREYDDLMSEFREAFNRHDFDKQDHIEHIIFLRKVAEVWMVTITQSYGSLVEQLEEKVCWIRDQYLAHHQPGDAVPRMMQLLKGCMRESEVDRVWALSRMPMNRVHHMRSKFYTDDFFTPMPSLEDDALPMANLIKARQPDVLTVAFDPEGTGPDTHYKVLTVVAAGLRISLNRSDLENEDILIWGYRNVWFVFPPSEATLMVPCSEEDLDLMHDTFMSCFTTQKKASFPSPHYDGPFSAWARQIQRNQKDMLVTLLGEEYFTTHLHPKVRDSAGFIFIHAMNVKDFLSEVEDLKSKFENVA